MYSGFHLCWSVNVSTRGKDSHCREDVRHGLRPAATVIPYWIQGSTRQTHMVTQLLQSVARDLVAMNDVACTHVSDKSIPCLSIL